MLKKLLHPIKRRIAKYYLVFLRKFFDLKVVGITGSTGKTSTKEMLFSILRLKDSTVATVANIDPVYNIPTTILKCTPLTKYLVLEMGIEYPHEMDFYLWLARPDIGVILNIHATHTEFLKDETGVFNEKKKLVDGLSKDGIAILNKDDKMLKTLTGKIKSKIIWFGKSDEKEILEGVQLPILGEQFRGNAIAAAKCALALGVPLNQIKQGLESFTPPEHRMRLIKLKNGALILDDSYNSNPAAAKEALKTLKDFAKDKKKIAVMGDMLELGVSEEKYHKEIGEIIGKMDLDFVIGVGQASKILVDVASIKLGEKKVRWVADETKVLKVLNPHLTKNSALLIKGSRGIQLENLVEKLTK